MERSQIKSIKPKMKEHKFKKNVNCQGALKLRGVKPKGVRA
jgi:hypothetical protein